MELIPHEVNETSTFIGGWFSKDFSILDEINDYFDQRKKQGTLFEGLVGDINSDGGEVDKTHKDSYEVRLTDNPTLWWKYQDDYLQNVLEEYKKLYPWSDKVSEYKCDPIINVQEYPKNSHGFNSWHTERSSPGTLYRHLVFMTYLNDVDTAGETEFLYQKVKIKPKKGLTLIWPAEWTHTHKGYSSPTVEKRIVTGWYKFTEDNC